jgi:hypothetical protein
MKAGKELDALVAEKVFGWKRLPMTLANGQPSYRLVSPGHSAEPADPVPNYSTNPAAAWSVVEKMWDFGFNMVRGKKANEGAGFTYDAAVYDKNQKCLAQAVVDTEPLATCLAALNAVAAES